MISKGKYDYLKRFVNRDVNIPGNWFGCISQNKIEEAENKIGFKFPYALKEFWLEIGYGFFHEAVDGSKTNAYSNRIATPGDIASIILKEEDSPMLLYLAEELPEDVIPFFEIGDSSDFLFMKKGSDDGVYRLAGKKIADTLEEFIWKLYHESPAYYIWIGKEDQDPYRVKKQNIEHE